MSISKLQIRVATYVFELSAGNCHRYMAALSSFIVTCNDRYAHDCKDGAAITRWRHPWICVPRKNSVALCGFCGQKLWQQRISTKKCCPCTMNIACHVNQSSNTSFGGTLSWRWDAVERIVCVLFRQRPQEFYAAGFQGLVKRWDKCLNLFGDYVEK